MGRYTGTLHKLVDSACVSNSRKKWDQVLFYLEGHTVPCDTMVPPFESPLAPNMAASPELLVELLDAQGPKRDDTPLKVALKAAPANVVAALCHLGPEAARMADGRDRLPLHWACRRSSEDVETEKVLQVLAQSNPEALVHRDDGGRTPLHWLFWHHAPTRSADIVRFLSQELPNDLFLDLRQPKPAPNERYPLPDVPFPFGEREIPPSAAIVPDAKHGALPLHYAVMQGATKEVLKTLIQQYPQAVHMGDRRGRSALAWYLGAGTLVDKGKHVCGEANDPHVPPWHETRLSIQTMQMLVSSKVARMVDHDLGRTPLHWACHFYALSAASSKTTTTTTTNDSGGSNHGLGPSISTKVFQILVDQYVEAVALPDAHGDTPLHVIFKVVADVQDKEWQRLKGNQSSVLLRMSDKIDLIVGGPAAFSPPKALLELLLKSPDADGQDSYYEDSAPTKGTETAAYMEDESGCLPLHAALRCATSCTAIQLLIQANPTSLVHTSEEQMQTPLVSAYTSEYSAPLQPVETLDILLAAYVTSRHGTYMDGRLALKMEDALGHYPIHYACKNQASFESIKVLVEKFNRCAIFQNADGDLPVHSLLSKKHLFVAPRHGFIQGATLTKPEGLLSETEKEWLNQLEKVQQLKMRILLEPLRMREHLKIASFSHGMTPLHVAIAFGALPYEGIYRMIDMYPAAAQMLTTEEGQKHSVLELHDWRKDKAEDADEWQAIRELLYAFHPLLESHRGDEELLDACVRMIRSEITGQGSFHLTKHQESKENGPAKIDIMETLSAINVPDADRPHRPKKNNRQPRRVMKSTLKPVDQANSSSPSQQGSSFIANLAKKMEQKKPAPKKSIYDADLDNRYVVSPQNSLDDDDSQEFDGSSEDEEFDSDEDSGTAAEESHRHVESSSWDERGVADDIDEEFSESLSQTFSCVDVLPSASSADKSISLLKKAKQEGVYDEKTITPSIFEEKKVEMLDEHLNSFHLSDVATRLWCFFVAYNNKKDPEDNYLFQVESILEDLEFDIVERLIDLAVPDYAKTYMDPGLAPAGLTLRDIASPKVKAIFESYYYFLGRFEFSTDVDGVLLHRSCRGNTVLIRATEHVVRTTEYQPPKRLDPGAAEESIWKTGEAIYDEEGYVASKFRDKRRPVYFKLTQSVEIFQNEVASRSDVGMENEEDVQHHILPLLSHFNSRSDQKNDRRYRMDARDERFRTLRLYGGKSISLSDFPYALVYPYSEEGDLYGYFYHQGVNGMSEISDIGRQIAQAVKAMHDHGIVHGNLSMQNIAMLPLDHEAQIPHRTWVVSDFSGACRPNQTNFMGCVSSDGSVQFESGLMPPEMFVVLSKGELEVYRDYWTRVSEKYGVALDQSVIEPYIDQQTGVIYAMRCHSEAAEREMANEGDLPELPYRLLAARESVDLWCLGVLLFTLCSGGRPLFPTNIKSGHVLEMNTIFRWDKKLAAALVYENVKDGVAQDLLLKLLTPYEDRIKLSIDEVLQHPFFTDDTSPQSLEKLVLQHQSASTAYMRHRDQMINQKSQEDWIRARTDVVSCWNFDLLRTIHFSSSEIIRKIIGGENTSPSSLLLLPYRLSGKNKKAKLAPTTKKDVERAERMGLLLLSLAKACHFGARVEETVVGASIGQKWDSSTLLTSLILPTGDFEQLKEEFAKIAAERIEAFRADPMTAVNKLIEKRYFEIRTFFKEAGKTFLYLVDEHAGIPLVGPAYDPYPIEISESAMSKMLAKALPFMHTSSMVARGVSGSVSGVVRLIFEAAYPHIPPSWAAAASGLTHTLDEELIKREVMVLQRTLSGLNSSKASRSLGEDLRFLRDSCAKVDIAGNFAGLRRVKCADSCIWTSPEGSMQIQQACRAYDFREALNIQLALETKLRSQEQVIKQLQDKVDWLSFRKELNLKVPGEPSFSTHSATPASLHTHASSASKGSGGSQTIKMENLGSNAAGPAVSVAFNADASDTGTLRAHSAMQTVPEKPLIPSPREQQPGPSATVTTTTPVTQTVVVEDVRPAGIYDPDVDTGTMDTLETDEGTAGGPDDRIHGSISGMLSLGESSVGTAGTKSTFQDNISVD